jgi:hypothetical protein
LILEAKFWASLTDNQPIEYLNRLPENAALVFIVPTLRVRPVFDELVKRIISTHFEFTADPKSHSITFLAANKHLIVKTWNEILGTIRLYLVQDNDQVLLSDIDQIIGLCDTIDNNSFLPIQADDFSPKYAKKINSYYDLIDKVVDELKKRELANTQGLNSAAQKYSYYRFFKIGNFGASLSLNFKLWAERSDTPIWLSIKDNTNGIPWLVSNEFKRKLKSVSSQLGFTLYEANNKEMFIALFPKFDKTEDFVINDLADQITSLNEHLEIQ